MFYELFNSVLLQEIFVMLKLFNDRRPKLIINADDLGYSANRDLAAFRLIQLGIVTSSSIIVNFPGSQTVVSQCLKLGFVPGLHINITEGKPLFGQAKTLLNEQGEFKGKSAFYGLNIPNLNSQEIYQQVNRQVEWFIHHFDRLPTHVDGHNHIHMIPVVAKVVAQVMQEHGIYKYRYPVEALDQETPFNRQILQNCKQSKQYYENKNMITTDAFIGLQLINSFSYEKFKDSLEKHSTARSIQIMVHPGLESESELKDQFHTSPHRKNEYNVLASEQMKKLLEKYHLVSWRDLSLSKPYNQKSILVHSVMKRGTGNQTSSLRIRDLIVSAGYTVYLRNIIQHNEKAKNNEVQDIQLFTNQFKINLVIGVNLYRSGLALLRAFYDPQRICNQVPFYLIIAGTDANIYLKKPQLKKMIVQGISRSQGLISLNDSLKKQVQNALEEYGIEKKIILIPQSETEHKGVDLRLLQQSFGLSNRKYIIFPASIRKVKDILFAIQEMNLLIDKYNIDICIFGPILEKQYAQQVIKKLEKVKYLGTISHDKLLTLLQGSICLINTSTSQGMSNAILEAQINGILPVVRGNDGNRNLVEHKKTGLLFTSPKQFFENISWMLQNQQNAKQLARSAQQISKARFSRQQQERKYKQLLQKHFSSNESHLICNGKKFFISGAPHVHPIGEINCQLFSRIPNIQGKNILDLGCGTGVFSFYYISKVSSLIKQLTFADISLEVLGKTYFNYLQNKEFFDETIQNIVFLKSDMFAEIKQNNIKYDIILANMPQCPFPVDNVKIDKNGGRNGFRFNSIILKELSCQSNTTKLITLFSYMGNPASYFKTIQQLNLHIQWRSNKLYHIIHHSLYQKACQGMNEFLNQMKKQQISDFDFEDGVYRIGAQILLIKKK